MSVAVDNWFWGTAEWSAYEAAYGRSVEHFGAHGNLVVKLGPETEMWRLIRKGHRAAIRKGQRTMVVMRTAMQPYEEMNWGGQSAEFQMWDSYQILHRLHHGWNVRPPETFALMGGWVRARQAMLFLAMPNKDQDWDGEWTGAALFILFQGGTYYASAARHPLRASDEPVGHLLLWEAMRTFAEYGYRWLDLGCPPDADATDKERSVYAFKKGFGGEIKRWPYE